MAADAASRARHDRRSIHRVESRPTRSPRLLRFGPLCCYLILCLIVSNGLTAVHAVPVTQQDSPSTTDQATTTSTPTASPGATKSDTLVPTASSSHSSASSSSSTTQVPGTVVTDSPLVRTSLSHSLASISSFSSNQSYYGSSGLASDVHVPSSTSTSPTIYPSPPSDGDDDDSDDAPTNSTYNSLLNFYFLILGAAIAAALVGWWCWRRRRKGKNSRERHRGIEALRRDLELGRLRRGFLGVVGRSGNSNPNSSEELPAYYFRARTLADEKVSIGAGASCCSDSASGV
jgi:hypothetical protein